MPRYFIDSDDGDFRSRDDEGLACADAEAAIRQAVTLLPDMARHTPPRGAHHTYAIGVRDEAGRLLCTAELEFRLTRGGAR